VSSAPAPAAIADSPAPTSYPIELIFSAAAAWDGASTPGAGRTQRANFGPVLVADLITTTQGTYQATATAGGTNGWVIERVCFNGQGHPVYAYRSRVNIAKVTGSKALSLTQPGAIITVGTKSTSVTLTPT
jgi:hypothetical protein